MKTTFNFTTSRDDLDRYSSPAELEEMLQGFDGVELMSFGPDGGLLPPGRVIGLHMHFFPCWLPLWQEDGKALLREFDSWENVEHTFGGCTRDALVESVRRDMQTARRYGAEYAVFHVSDATIEESFTWKYSHTDEEVVLATAEVLNEALAGEDGSIALLLENLWQPGLTLRSDNATRLLMTNISYPNKGIMFDTGHLMHMDTSLHTQEDALRFILRTLDEHPAAEQCIRGMHLHQSLTGEYCEKTVLNPPPMAKTYEERQLQMFLHAFAVDRHRPFICEGIKELVERVSPEYLTFEFITGSKEEHRRYLEQQKRSFL